MAVSLSPLAPESFPSLPPLAGVRLAAAACGVKYRGRSDVCLIALGPGSTAAGVFTTSKTASAPVEWCRAKLADGKARALLINSGNANAFTGKAGEDAVRIVARQAAKRLGCQRNDVLVASTGVIGELLPHERVVAGLDRLVAGLDEAAWPAAAKAIMTTDTFAKGATRSAEIAGVKVTLNGIAKGSGMIAPDMATMLAFVMTDAKLPAALLQNLLRLGNERSFNAITVDGDTSTSDGLILAATGKAKHAAVPADIRPDDPMIRAFRTALDGLLIDLAQQVVRDGEGASKFVTIKVVGATTRWAARRIGLAVANSPLVKTAIAGADANWGRIVMAVGKSGARADRDRLGIRIGGIEVARWGRAVPGYDEAPVARHMAGQEIDIEIEIGIGRGQATVWTCDLTHGYIEINADYRS